MERTELEPNMGGDRSRRRGADAARVLAGACLVTLIGILTVLPGCTTSECDTCGPSQPADVTVTLSQEAVQVTREVTAHASTEREALSLIVDWYVDGVLGGTAATGTITQDNPATYTAPATIPGAGAVAVEARLRSDPSVTAADSLTVLFTVLYVDAADGNDVTGNGSWAAPLLTVTAALDTVAAGDTVHVFPGVYDQAHGETPPFAMPVGTTLRGSHRDSCILDGVSGDDAVILTDGSTIEHFTLTNPGTCQTGITSMMSGTIRNIAVHEPFSYAAIRSGNATSDVEIFDCELVNTSRVGEGRGLELIWGCHATLRGCTISGWNQGIFLNTTSDPLVEGCEITGNVFGVDSWESDDIMAPDFGGGDRAGSGGNTISGNSFADFVNRTPSTVYAWYNTWEVPVPSECVELIEGCNIVNTGTGSVQWCECATR